MTFWEILLNPLRNERGEAGTYTPEELEILGEEASEASEQLGEQGEFEEQAETGEQAAQEEKAASATAEEGEAQESPTQKRIDRLTWEREERQRKLDLFKERDPERYYELYPDEKPAGWTPPVKEPVKEEPDYGNMVIRGGKYPGKTVNEVLEVDPAYAFRVIASHELKQEVKARQKKETETARRQAAETEWQTFQRDRFTELYGEKEEYSAQEKAVVNNLTAQALDLIKKGRVRHLNDAYLILNHEAAVKKAKAEGATNTLKKISEPPVGHIGSGKQGSEKTGNERYYSMTQEQLATEMNNMGESEFTKFCKNAPAKLKEKFPSLFWD